jgi:3-deoxy-D-manno-octulosonate 8-phosphate phosphatase (KDO 8-P phosphatase)
MPSLGLGVTREGDEHHLTWEDCWYVGNDVNDLGAIRKACFSLCPRDAVEEVVNTVDYVLKTNSGYGVLCEIVTELESLKK